MQKDSKWNYNQTTVFYLDKSDGMASIFNQIISEAVYPSCLRTAKIVPIFKEGDKSFLCNCERPISLVSVIGKVFENLLSKRIINFFNKFEVLSNKQFGFRKKHSTVDAIVETWEILIESNILMNWRTAHYLKL